MAVTEPDLDDPIRRAFRTRHLVLSEAAVGRVAGRSALVGVVPVGCLAHTPVISRNTMRSPAPRRPNNPRLPRPATS